MFSVSLNFQNKNQKQPLFPKQSSGSLREVNTSSPHIFLDFPPANWRWYLLLLNLPHSTCLARMLYTCSVSARIHQSIWQLTYCLIPGWKGNAGHLGSVFKWCDSSCGKPRERQALAALLASGKEEWGEQKGDVFIYPEATVWLICQRTHCELTFLTL